MIDAASGVAEWLRSTHHRSGSEAIWPDDAMRPSVQSLDLADGVAGQVWFFSELYSVSRDSRDLAAVREGAEMLMREIERQGSVPPMDGETTLYRGVPSAAIALRAAHRATNEPRYGAAYRSIANDLARRARTGATSASWSDSLDVLFGDAGTGLFLLEAGRELRDTTLVNTAVAVARTLAQRGIAEHGGLTWRRMTNSRFILPNFSHGAAGIGLFLSAAGRTAYDPALDSAAMAASRYLVAVGQRDSLGFRVPYGWPAPPGGWARPFDVGWAHGSAGTARLFWQLWRATGDSTYLALVEDCVRAVRAAGLFGTPRPEYGRAPFALTMRFDLAGVADFLADLYSVTGNRRDLELARAIADTIVARADRSVVRQLRWVAPRYGFMSDPGQPGAMTGYLHGATGYGILFLKLHALERGIPAPQRLPDNPFGR
jgi:lantibiotic modifying enzyme